MTIAATYPVTPMREPPQTRDQRRIEKTFSVAVAAGKLAKDAGLILIAHVPRQWEIRDPVDGVQVFAYPAEQRIRCVGVGPFAVRTDGRDWSIEDVVRGYLAKGVAR